jgi:RNA polymerase sigma-70 factor (ECF subfamily)
MSVWHDHVLDPGYSESSVSGEEVVPRARIAESSFRLLYEQTARPLWAYLLRVSGDRDTADDLLQESYCRFLAAELPPMDPAHCKSYLFRVATNLLRDRWRRNEPVLTGEAPEGSCEDGMESRADVRHAFDMLKPRERQLLWLAHVEGSDHREIARLTGLKTGSVRLLLFRARRRLAGALRNRVVQSGEKVNP